MRRICLTCIVLLAATSTLEAAQPERGGALDPAKAADPRGIAQLRLDLPDRTDLAAEDAERDAAGEPFRFALPEDVALTPQNAGTWEDLPGGRRLWRQRVTVPGALSLSLGFVRYTLPASGRLALYPVARPNEGYVFDAGDNAAHGQLWTPVLLTDDLVIELVVDTAERHLVDLELGTIGRGYRYFGEDFTEKSGACNVPVICPPGDPWRLDVTTVGVYQIEAAWKCTGAMINNTNEDGQPLFLTASHCDVFANLAPSVVVYWNYESATCDPSSPGSLDDSQSGSTLLVKWGGVGTSDVCLLELTDLPDPSYGVAYAGWSREDVAPAGAVAIHHPQTDEKSISFEDDPLTITGYNDDVSPGDGTHLRVADWDLGTTEIGSSGSPLFDPNHRIVGQLHGGYAGCGNDLPDWYGRLTASWAGGGTPGTRLRDWLDPLGTGAIVLDGRDPVVTGIIVMPTTGLAFEGPAGGPFTPQGGVYTVATDASMAVDYVARVSENWLVADPVTGTVGPGDPDQVAVSLTAAAADLGEGQHLAHVDFINLTGGPGEVSIPVILDVRPASISVTPTTGIAFTGPVGGPFTPLSGTYTVVADGSMAVAYTVVTSAGWLDADPTGGTLDPGAQAQITVELDGSVVNLGVGRYSARVDFVNVTGGPGGLDVPVVLDIYSVNPRITNVIPNPSWGPVDIEFTVGRDMDVHIRFYDVRGMLVADRGMFRATEGVNIYTWSGTSTDGHEVPGSVYIVEIEGNGHKDRRKLVQTD